MRKSTTLPVKVPARFLAKICVAIPAALLIASTLTGCGSTHTLPDVYLNGTQYRGEPVRYRITSADETIHTVSKRYGLPAQSIAKANNLQRPYALSTGQWLTIPTDKNLYRGNGGLHKVHKGENLYRISRRYNTSIDAIASVNNLSTPYTIHVGQDLKIPKNGFKGGTVVLANKKAVGSRTAVQPKPKATSVKAPKQLFSWPVNGKTISGYGDQGSGQKNDGINVAAPTGTRVQAVADGTVAYSGNEIRGYGNLVLIKHADGWISTYAHLNNLAVTKGQQVKRGTTVGGVGQTGSVDKPQLHFELRYGKRAVNPVNYLTRKSAALPTPRQL